ncbi:hypothetical protein BCR34DRAFT_11945 [Clohesyomyces aquaticus]|uniref:Uncharacterized protein n=1 Tax=Clohesyomyces aquaticus TaxID=1231657 RepID=A0A1Y1ZE41_9PLEO|nr:hypothetical protein BCR34DRAFT_11945 [Clohesyomyces aquaticus]
MPWAGWFRELYRSYMQPPTLFHPSPSIPFPRPACLQEAAVSASKPDVFLAVDTRCRLCSKRICPYIDLSEVSDNMEFTCFVYGNVIDGSDVWYKTEQGTTRCYVPLNGGSSIS